MIDELLERAVVFFRRGQAPAGAVSFEAYLRHPDRKESRFDSIAVAAIHAGDYLFAADAISVGILAAIKSGQSSDAGTPEAR